MILLLMVATTKMKIWLLYLFVYRNEHSVPLVNISDLKGWTPLHYACSDNNLEFVQLLLDAGADQNAKYFSKS